MMIIKISTNKNFNDLNLGKTCKGEKTSFMINCYTKMILHSIFIFYLCTTAYQTLNGSFVY